MPYIENRLTYILHEYVIFIPQVLPFQGMKANEEGIAHAPQGQIGQNPLPELINQKTEFRLSVMVW